MEYKEIKNIVLEDLKYINKEIKEESINKLYLFMNNLIEWNKNINLTAIKDEREIILKHFIDSIYISDLIKGKVLDIGSGAGFPGLPLKIIDENLELVSIDSVNKKINFQLDTIKKLELKNIEALHVRAEELAHDNKYREKFDFVVSRAVANLSTLSEYMIPFVKVGGKCICLKGPNCEEEINDAKSAIKLLGSRIESVKEYKISEEIDRTIVIISKEKNTNILYPRGQGKPSKNPLK